MAWGKCPTLLKTTLVSLSPTVSLANFANVKDPLPARFQTTEYNLISFYTNEHA
jgi:hypothetical protein